MVFALNFCVLDLSRIFGGVIVIWQHLCLSVNEICDRVNIYKKKTHYSPIVGKFLRDVSRSNRRVGGGVGAGG